MKKASEGIRSKDFGGFLFCGIIGKRKSLNIKIKCYVL
jgi:hypothetical protein